MEELQINDEFSQFIINDYLSDSDMTILEKLELVFSSMDEFAKAMDCFKLSNGVVNKH